MAVAGFGRDDIEVSVKENELLVAGKSKKDEEQNAAYLHRGIARRAFERRFQLADHIKVSGASLDNGLLHVDLTREVPEEKKPRKIEIAQLGFRPGDHRPQGGLRRPNVAFPRRHCEAVKRPKQSEFRRLVSGLLRRFASARGSQ